MVPSTAETQPIIGTVTSMSLPAAMAALNSSSWGSALMERKSQSLATFCEWSFQL
ncbi:MAG: hypothetical protein QM765_26115 [Myxococcales bacterium]